VEDYEEIEKLTTWYEYFLNSYQEFEAELQRRKDNDNKMRQKMKDI
jgi:hypothetical protein